MKRAHLLSMCVIVATAALAPGACAENKGPAVEASTLVVGTRAEPKTLNPVAIASSEGHQIAALIFQKLLVEQDDFISFKPGLAREWSLSPDGLDVIFKLREDARWSDGKPVTASDVRFTWQVYTDTTVAWPSASIKARIRDVEVRDAKTVVFHFKERYLYQLMDANDGVILPEHLLASIPRAELKAAPFGRAPVGNGEYILKRWESGQYIDLAANPRYFGPAPKIERVLVKFVPDVVTLVSQLKAGEIDLLEAVQASDLAAIRAKRPDVEILDVPSRRLTFIAWNHARAPFESASIRGALTNAIDREAIIRNVWGGYARESTSPLVPLQWAFDPSIAAIPFDPDAARSSLRAQGFADANGDGILERDGKPFSFDLLVNDAQARIDAVTLVQAQLKKVGIDVNVRVMEYNAYIERILAKDYDAAFVEWKMPTKVDLTPLFHSRSIRPKGLNFISYSNPELDRLIDDALAQSDMTKAGELWAKAQRIVVADQPYTFVAVPQELIAVDDRFCNLAPSPISIFAHIADWRIKPDCDRAGR